MGHLWSLHASPPRKARFGVACVWFSPRRILLDLNPICHSRAFVQTLKLFRWVILLNPTKSQHRALEHSVQHPIDSILPRRNR